MVPTAGLGKKKLMEKINTNALSDVSGKEPSHSGYVQFYSQSPRTRVCIFTLEGI